MAATVTSGGASTVGPSMSSKENLLSKYLQEKSPFIHDTKFDLSLKEYPLGPILLPIPLSSELLGYETSALEVLHRWMNFQNLSEQIDLDEMIDYELATKSEEMQQCEEPLDLSGVVPSFILDQVKQLATRRQEKSSKLLGISPLKSAADNTQNNWLRLSKEQRVQIYMDSIRNSFVDPKTLVNPKNPNLKQKKVYKVMPNVQHWKNTYIHTSISGGVAEIDKGERGFMRVTEETPTSKQFEYYCSVGMEGKAERFSFLRNYTCQHSAKGSVGENYYLMLLPQQLYQLANQTLENKSNFQLKQQTHASQSQGIDGNATDIPDADNDTIYIISIKGQKSVLTKAGGGKKHDYLITYKDDDEEEGEDATSNASA